MASKCCSRVSKILEANKRTLNGQAVESDDIGPEQEGAAKTAQGDADGELERPA
jgi:hypothetical protein